MATLIVTLPQEMPGPGTELDFLLTTDGRTITRHGRASAGLLPPTSGTGSEIIAIVPARMLSWHLVALPAKLLARTQREQRTPSPQLRAALEGLLEDQLLDDTATLHFALGPQASQERKVWVAVCQRPWLTAHLQALEQARRSVTRIVPEYAPVPGGMPAQLHVTAGLAPAQAVHAGPHGVAVWPLVTTAAPMLAWPESAEILAEPGVAALAETFFRRPVTLLATSQRWLNATHTDWNLAQFDLARSGRNAVRRQIARGWQQLRHEPRWRAARWMLMALLASQLLGLNALAWRERSLLAQKRQAVDNVLKQTFPEVPVILDAPLQMEREVRALQLATGSSSAGDLSAMLAALLGAVPAGQSVSGIDYSAGELRVRGLRLGQDDSAAMVARLNAQGYAMHADGERWLLRTRSAP